MAETPEPADVDERTTDGDDEVAAPEVTASADAAEDVAEVDAPDEAEAAAAGDGDPSAAPRAEAEPREPAVNDSLPDEELDRVVEALLFAAAEPLTAARLAEAAQVSSPRRVRQAIDRLRAEYQRQLRAFDVVEIAGGFRLYSRPEYQEFVARLEKARAPERLSASALETLAIVAYRQPITRAEIDAVRGVQSGGMLKSLLDKKLIRVAGRSDQPGRPLQYGTTKRFLDHFGLASVKDLPRVEDLKSP